MVRVVRMVRMGILLRDCHGSHCCDTTSSESGIIGVASVTAARGRGRRFDTGTESRSNHKGRKRAEGIKTKVQMTSEHQHLSPPQPAAQQEGECAGLIVLWTMDGRAALSDLDLTSVAPSPSPHRT